MAVYLSSNLRGHRLRGKAVSVGEVPKAPDQIKLPPTIYFRDVPRQKITPRLYSLFCREIWTFWLQTV